MQMKFSQLAIGQRFHWQGAEYVKVNSLMARQEGSGKQQLVPRYSAVEVAAGDAPPPAPSSVATSAVREAFERFYAVALDGADAAKAQALATARQRFLDAIER